MLEIHIKTYISIKERNINRMEKDNKSINTNYLNKRNKTIKLRAKNYINRSKLIFSYLIEFLIVNYILFKLPKTAFLIKSPDSYIKLETIDTGEQQIFSKDYDINKFYPYRIFINGRVHILRDKKVFLENNNRIIMLEWNNTNPNLSYMFANLQSIQSVYLNNIFNESLNNLSYMFYNCKNLRTFAYSNSKNNFEIVDTTKMFYNCISLTSLSFENNYTANNINMSYMFYNCHKLNEIYFASTMIVNNIKEIFSNCYSLKTIDLSNFQSIIEIDASQLFYNCHNLTNMIKTDGNILINDMNFMFYNCYKLTSINLTNFKINSSINMSYSFYNCQNLIDLDWTNGIVISNNPTDMRNMFYNCSSIKLIELPFSQTNDNINMTKMFFNCINLTDIILVSNSLYKPNDIHAMFYNCFSLISLNLNGRIKTDNVSDMSYLFYNCSSLISLNISFTGIKTKNMKSMFQNCKSLTSINLHEFQTSNVEIMWNMFKGCEKLESLNLDLFDTSKVTDMESMFEGCSNLISLSLEHFNTTRVKYMNKMFKDCTSLKSLNFRNIKTSSVGTMHQMFYNCQSLEYLNIYSMIEMGQTYKEMFTNTPNNFIFCIKEKENIPNIFELLFDKNDTVRDCSSDCYGNERLNISEKKLCCPFVRYKDNCYNNCPTKTKIIDKINICEDFNCTNYNEYYNYEQNNCTTDIRGFYINDSSSKTIDKCHDDCLECNEKWTNESSKCTVCKSEKPYIYLGNCYRDCEPGFLFQDNRNICKCFDQKCELCSEDSLSHNLCETCNMNYYPIENEPTLYYNWINCYKEPENYYLFNATYKPCFSSCKYCIKEGNYAKQFCTICNINNSFALIMEDTINSIEPTYNCYPNCSYYYYFDENEDFQCTQELKCPENYDKLINKEKRCVKSCFDTKKINMNSEKYVMKNVHL